MEIKFTKIILLIVSISTVSYIIFIYLGYYNSLENIEKRCTLKFQKEVEKVEGKSDEEWGLNMDIAYENCFKCMKIP